MNRDRMRTVVAVMVIAAMVLLAVGAVGSLLGGPADASAGSQLDAAVPDHQALGPTLLVSTSAVASRPR